MARRKSARQPLNQSQIVERLANTTGLTRKQVKELLGALAALAHQEVVQTGEFVLPGLGTLTHMHRAARQGRNPFTGEEIKVPALKVVRFKPGKSLKSTLAGDNTTDSDI